MGFIIFIVAAIFIAVRVIKNAENAQPSVNEKPNNQGYVKPGAQRAEMKPYPHPGYPVPPGKKPVQKQAKNVAAKAAAAKEQEMSTHEGECIETEPVHCAVEHTPDSVYATEISDKPDISREQLVNGIIMAELLSKPKCFDR